MELIIILYKYIFECDETESGLYFPGVLDTQYLDS